VVLSSVSPSLSPVVAFCASLPAGARVGVVGSCEFPALDLVREFVSLLPASCVVVSGGAPGVDSVAQLSAESRGLWGRDSLFPADWDRFGPAAGPIRNQELVSSCSVVVAFHDGVSRGTKDAIARARRCDGVRVFVVSPPAAPGSLVQSSLF